MTVNDGVCCLQISHACASAVVVYWMSYLIDFIAPVQDVMLWIRLLVFVTYKMDTFSSQIKSALQQLAYKRSL